MLSFCQNIKTKISFSNEKLTLLIDEEISNCLDKEFLSFLKIFEGYVSKQISKEEFELELKMILNFLKQNEFNFIFSFLKNIGGFYQDEEIEQLTNFEIWLQERLKDTINFNKKFLNVYFKLFIILGLMIFIIFI